MFQWKLLVCTSVLAALTFTAEPAIAQQEQDFTARAARQPSSAGKPDFARYLAGPDGSMPLIQDWSTRHIIYTAGYTAEQAGKMARDPRAFASFLTHGMVRRRQEPVGHHRGTER